MKKCYNEKCIYYNNKKKHNCDSWREEKLDDRCTDAIIKEIVTKSEILKMAYDCIDKTIKVAGVSYQISSVEIKKNSWCFKTGHVAVNIVGIGFGLLYKKCKELLK